MGSHSSWSCSGRERWVQVGVPVEPRLCLLELRGETEQEAVGAERADELDAERQPGGRPVQRHARSQAGR